jgi:hypothetical protein
MIWTRQWLTPREFAHLMGRPERTVQEWAHNGTLVEFGIPVFCVSRGRYNHRHYIYAQCGLAS